MGRPHDHWNRLLSEFGPVGPPSPTEEGPRRRSNLQLRGRERISEQSPRLTLPSSSSYDSPLPCDYRGLDRISIKPRGSRPGGRSHGTFTSLPSQPLGVFNLPLTLLVDFQSLSPISTLGSGGMRGQDVLYPSPPGPVVEVRSHPKPPSVTPPNEDRKQSTHGNLSNEWMRVGVKGVEILFRWLWMEETGNSPTYFLETFIKTLIVCSL